MLGVEFEIVDRVRVPASWKHKRNYEGYYWAATTGGHVWFESLYERAALMRIDRDRDVVGIAAQPMWIHWSSDGGKHAPGSLLASFPRMLEVPVLPSTRSMAIATGLLSSDRCREPGVPGAGRLRRAGHLHHAARGGPHPGHRPDHAEGSLTNLSRSPEPYAAQAEFSFATDDPPARVRALLVDVARDIPLVSPDRDPRVTTLDGAKFQVSIPLQSPGDKAVVLDAFATRLWYAARRVDLHLNGDLADDWNSPARLQDALHEIAPILSLRSEDAEALAASALSRNDPVGLTALTRNVFG